MVVLGEFFDEKVIVKEENGEEVLFLQRSLGEEEIRLGTRTELLENNRQYRNMYDVEYLEGDIPYSVWRTFSYEGRTVHLAVWTGDFYDDAHNPVVVDISYYKARCQWLLKQIYRFVGAIGACDRCRRVMLHSNEVQEFEPGYNRTTNVVHVCDSCYEELPVCEVCGNKETYHTRVEGIEMCGHCFEEWEREHPHHHYCENCDSYFDEEVGDHTYALCPSCYDKVAWSDRVHSYDWKPKPWFLDSSSMQSQEPTKGVRYYGCELETEGGNISDYCYELNKALNDNSYEHHAYFMHDGSLEDGVETATSPIAFEYAMTSYPFDIYESVAEQNKMVAHDTTTCGFHIHVNRDSIPDFELTTAKILLTFDKFYDRLLRIARRRSKDRPEHWCCKPNADIQRSETPDSLKRKLDLQKDHYRAVNLSPEDTIEFRLWKGTIRANTIRSTIDFLNALINVCATSTLSDVYDWTWEEFLSKVTGELFAPETTIEYIKSRGVM